MVLTDHKAADLLLAADHPGPTRPVWLVRPAELDGILSRLTSEQRAWLAAIGFKAAARKFALLPGAAGAVAGALLGLGDAPDRNPVEPASALTGLLPGLLPPGDYHIGDGHIATDGLDHTLAAIAFGLGAYRFRRYKSGDADPLPRLKLATSIDRAGAIVARPDARAGAIAAIAGRDAGGRTVKRAAAIACDRATAVQWCRRLFAAAPVASAFRPTVSLGSGHGQAVVKECSATDPR